MCWSNCLQDSHRLAHTQLWAEQFLFTAASSSCRNSGQSVEHEWLKYAAITGTFVPRLYLWGLGNLWKKKEKECDSQRKGSYITLTSRPSVATAHLHSEGSYLHKIVLLRFCHHAEGTHRAPLLWENFYAATDRWKKERHFLQSCNHW